MADDENKTDTPAAAESTEPSPTDTATEETAPKAPPKKATVKKSVKKAAPKKKAPANKVANSTEKESAAPAAASAQKTQEKPADMGVMPKQARSKRPAPAKSFWWRALLMVAVVIFLFSTIRDLAKAPQTDATSGQGDASALVSAIPDEQGAAVANGNVIVEEAPSQPPAGATMPTPGYYGYPYPPQQPYYYPQPGQDSGATGQPVYPMAPQGGYAYPYPPQRPYYPPYNPWYPPYPGQPAPEQQ